MRRPAMAAGELGLGSMYATTAPYRRRRPWAAGQGRRRWRGRKEEVRASLWATGSAPMPVDVCGGRAWRAPYLLEVLLKGLLGVGDQNFWD